MGGTHVALLDNPSQLRLLLDMPTLLLPLLMSSSYNNGMNGMNFDTYNYAQHPVSWTGSPSLGHAFLEHIFLIKALPTINKFHLFAIPFPTWRSNLTPSSKTSIALAVLQQIQPPETPQR
ncbi:hypothetical protein L873DRAFT_1794042 [Choiromyces venosus 120613-1]|uniref:Uncharacterized protein n=1 Tax=Choiromyces venosus 120613-1 TaxID=1336337 RepID=A0A3N4J3Q4_9PEZI|nr:hypothetical protein L873DRAFT_1794042 [Choiromyces venosus 120613-1]